MDLIGVMIHSGDMAGMIHIIMVTGVMVILIMQDSTILGIMAMAIHTMVVGIVIMAIQL